MGAIYKTGWSGDFQVTVKVAEASQNYNTGETLEAKEIKVPELIPEFRTLSYKDTVEEEDFNYDIG